MKIELLDDLEDAKELWHDFQVMHAATPKRRELHDQWPGNDHTYWSLTEGSQSIGLTSAVFRPEKGYVYLSYAIIMPQYEVRGLQRKLIRHRLRWAKKQGAVYAVTYTLLHNYPSMMNLLRCGFRFANSPRGWCGYGDDVHYFEKQL